MNYQSLQFILFTGIVLLVYYRAKPEQQRLVLALANLVFYVSAGWEYLPFLLAAMAASFLAARKISAVYRETDGLLSTCSDPAEKKRLRTEGKVRAKRALLAGMGVAIALLVVCKYTGFVLETLNLGLAIFRSPQLPVLRLILPLGISFYTFMALSYVLDVFWKRYPAEESFLTYAVYLSYFPHVVQGPIDRFNEFRDQIRGGVAFDYRNLSFGAQLMLWGFFKKLVVADRLGMFVDTVFEGWQEYSGLVLILSVVAYSIQIYADFSGCIDIVSGVSEMLGIGLRKNFNHPYFSRTMGEFWRRWHISLQEWFKDYIYYPVSASELMRRAKKRFREKNQKRASELFAACFPIFVVWMVTGIWHGAAWKFVAWGIFHAILLIGSRILEPVFEGVNRGLHIKTDGWFWRLWQILRTFFLCCVGRVFFRAENMAAAWGIFGKMLHPATSLQVLLNPPNGYGMDMANILMSVVVVLVLLAVDVVQERIRIRETLANKPLVLRWALIYICLFAVLILGIYGPGYDAASFIYEQF